MISSTRFGTMVHAQLFPGEENSGLLVSLLKRQARAIAEQEGRDLILCDGAPGIGCPVISSLSGTDLAVIVTEPTPSGSHDMMRVAELCGHFKVKPVIIINKYDLNPEIAASIEDFAREQGFAVVARLPHDPAITLAMVDRKAVTEVKDNTFAHHLREAWDAIRACLDEVVETQ
jgi:MinD superfamily P-loop ATPase